MVSIKCIVDDCGDEYLPDVTETELWSADVEINPTKRQEQMIILYNAIVRKENYWYNNSPTAFGNPDYSMYVGFAKGMLAGLGWTSCEISRKGKKWLIIKNGKRTVMEIQKPEKPKRYWSVQKDNAETLSALGL